MIIFEVKSPLLGTHYRFLAFFTKYMVMKQLTINNRQSNGVMVYFCFFSASLSFLLCQPFLPRLLKKKKENQKTYNFVIKVNYAINIEHTTS